MRRFLMMQISRPDLDHRFAWIVGFFFLVACTTLTLKMLPELDLVRSVMLVGAISTGWLVMVALLPGQRPVVTRMS